MKDRPTLEDIRKEFPKAHYAPDPECERCGGTGFTGPRKVIVIGKKPDGKLGAWSEERPDEGHSPCICVFVGDPAIRGIVRDGLQELAEEYKASQERCPVCGQIDQGQTGEHPCPECGLPRIWDDKGAE